MVCARHENRVECNDSSSGEHLHPLHPPLQSLHTFKRALYSFKRALFSFQRALCTLKEPDTRSNELQRVLYTQNHPVKSPLYTQCSPTHRASPSIPNLRLPLQFHPATPPPPPSPVAGNADAGV